MPGLVGRPRKSTAEHLLTGRAKHNPDILNNRKREPQPKAKELLSSVPPPWMSAKEKKAYTELVTGCHQNVLTTADSIWVEIVACLLAEYREGPRKFNLSKLTKLMQGLGQLGMNPAERNKTSTIPPAAEENPFNEFTQ